MGGVSIIGLDLAKNAFQLHGAGEDGSVVFRRKVSRAQLLKFMAAQPRCIAAMEACASSRHRGRANGDLGHEVRLISLAYVKPFVKLQKNAKPWKADSAGASTRNEALPAPKYLGHVLWRRWSGYHCRSCIETKMHRVKLLAQRLMAPDFARQVAKFQVRSAILNGSAALGIPVTKVVA